MISEYERIYNDLYESFSSKLISLMFAAFLPLLTKKRTYRHLKPLLPFTKGKIDEVINVIDPNIKIRPDVKYFLIINFFHMVALPLTIQSEDFSATYKEHLEKDIAIILTEAIHNATERKEITTTDIIKALPIVWENLGLNQIKVWGKIDE